MKQPDMSTKRLPIVDGPARLLKLYEARDAMAEPVIDGRVACKRGCSACCYQPIGITKAEAITIRDNIGMAPKVLHALNTEWIDVHGDHNEWWRKQRACVFLRGDNICSIYSCRPLVCRLHNALDSGSCFDKEPGASVAGLAIHHDSLFFRLAQIQWANMTAKGKTKEAYEEASNMYFMPSALLWAMGQIAELTDDHKTRAKPSRIISCTA